MRLKILWVFALVVALCGCERAYEQKNGQWLYDERPITIVGAHFKPLKDRFAADDTVGYFRGEAIEGSSGATFEPLGTYYARDKYNVYFCDMVDVYFMAWRNKVVVAQGALPESFRLLSQQYGRDAKQVWYEGTPVSVKDLETFEVLDKEYQRDRVTGYFWHRPIAGSDGSSFSVVGNGYSKDAQRVFFSERFTEGSHKRHRTTVLVGALPQSFAILDRDYATDSRQAWFGAARVTKDVASFQVLGSFYAKTDSAVYHRGIPVIGADAASFAVLQSSAGVADARDAQRDYLSGKPVVINID